MCSSRTLLALAIAGLLPLATAQACGPEFPYRLLSDRAGALGELPEGNFTFEVSRLGHLLASHDGVSLCYRRRLDGDWPYNLFGMIHGRSREAVAARREALAAEVGLAAFPHAVLFSTDCYKQCGARYRSPDAASPRGLGQPLSGLAA